MSNPILYNVTVHVENDIVDEWLDWMIQKHIPDVMKTDCFISYQLSKVLHESNDGSVSYAIQYKVDSMKTLHKYQVQYAPQLQKEHSDKFGQKCLAIRTLLELIQAK